MSLVLSLSFATSSVSAEDYTLDMRGVDIREFINTISKMTGKTIIIDEKVRGKVDIQSPTKLTEEELYEIFQVQLGISGYSVVDAENNILKVISSQEAKLEGSDVAIGIPERSSEEIITRVVAVKNVNANQLAATLRPLINNRLGIIAAYDTSNVILLTDRASNVRRIAQIIEQVDQADSQTLEMIQLNNASASELERILSSLTKENNQEKVGPPPIITSDKRTNTLIVRADATMRGRIRRIAKELDSEIQTTSNTRVIYLKYAQAKALVPVLKGVSDTIIKEETGQQGGSNAVTINNSNLHIDAHEQTNSLVMSGSPHIIKTLESIILQLDIRRAQVLVEAIIAEVSDDTSKELGLQWLLYGGDNKQTTSLGSINFGSESRPSITSLATTATTDSTVLGNGLSIGIGRFNKNGFSFASFITALNKDSDSNVLSTPSLVTMDNEEAYIQVGQEVPIITGSTASSNNSNPFQTIERKDIGIKLKVTPQINEGDAIKLIIEQEVSTLSGVQASDIVTNKRIISTTVLIDDGSTLALGGLISEDIQESTSKVPLLGDIPYMGRLFRTDETKRNKRNLMVFIRPTIIRDQAVANSISRQKYNYIHARQVLNAASNPLSINITPPTLPKWDDSQSTPPTIESLESKSLKAPRLKVESTTNRVFEMLGGDH